MSASAYQGRLVGELFSPAFSEAETDFKSDRKAGAWSLLRDFAKALVGGAVEVEASDNEIFIVSSGPFEPRVESQDGGPVMWWLYLSIKRQPDGTATVELWEPGG